MARHLRHDMRRRAEAVDAEALAVPCHLQRPVADQTGAEEGCRFRVAVALGQPENVARVRHSKLSVTAIDLIAGEEGAVAEILLS